MTIDAGLKPEGAPERSPNDVVEADLCRQRKPVKNVGVQSHNVLESVITGRPRAVINLGLEGGSLASSDRQRDRRRPVG
jgi:hypothetical protein